MKTSLKAGNTLQVITIGKDMKAQLLPHCKRIVFHFGSVLRNKQRASLTPKNLLGQAVSVWYYLHTVLALSSFTCSDNHKLLQFCI